MTNPRDTYRRFRSQLHPTTYEIDDMFGRSRHGEYYNLIHKMSSMMDVQEESQSNHLDIYMRLPRRD